MVHVIVHNSVSVDGRVEGVAADIALHYEVAATFDPDVHLAGSGTILAAEAEVDDQQAPDPPRDEPDAPDPPRGHPEAPNPPHDEPDAPDPPRDEPDAPDPPRDEPDDGRPLLAVVDSRGRVRSWAALRQAPFWRDRMVALCSHATPADHLERLAALHVDRIVVGQRTVDLAAALSALERDYGATRILVDSGGTLNGVLLRAGLVDEVSLLIQPQLVDGRHTSIVRPNASGGTIELRLSAVEQLAAGVVWLRYDVVRDQATSA